MDTGTRNASSKRQNNLIDAEAGKVFVDEARKWLGVKWQHQGRTRNGIDCIGLILHCAHEVGYIDKNNLPADVNHLLRTYGRQPHEQGLVMKRMAERFLKPAIGDMQVGDILLMRVFRSPQHWAIYAGDNIVIHASAEDGKVVEHSISGMEKRRTVRVMRMIANFAGENNE